MAEIGKFVAERCYIKKQGPFIHPSTVIAYKWKVFQPPLPCSFDLRWWDFRTLLKVASSSLAYACTSCLSLTKSPVCSSTVRGHFWPPPVVKKWPSGKSQINEMEKWKNRSMLSSLCYFKLFIIFGQSKEKVTTGLNKVIIIIGWLFGSRILGWK